MRTSLAAALVLLGAALPAQSFYIPTNTPGTGTCNAFPFGTTDMRYQTLIPATDLGSAPALIRGFALAPCGTGTRTFRQVTVKMAHLSATTLSTTFAANLGANPITVMDVTNHAWHLTANAWNEIDLQQPFPYNGTDSLVVEFLVLGSGGGTGTTHRDATHQRVYQGSYTGQATGIDGGLTAFKMRIIVGDASHQTFGTGCVGSNSQTPALTFSGDSKLGSTLNVDQAGAPATSPTVLHIGTTSATPFPLDLTPVGAPGCSLYNDALITVAMATTAGGTSTLPLPVPNNPALVGVKLYFQWIDVDPTANALGLIGSNYGRALVGN